MSKRIALVTFGVVAVFSLGWFAFINVGSTGATIVTSNVVPAQSSIISPFELMTTRGKALPVEQWPAF